MAKGKKKKPAAKKSNVGKKAKYDLHLGFGDEGRAELDRQKAWFGYPTDQEMVSKAVQVMTLFRQAEEGGDKPCVFDPKTSQVHMLQLHKEDPDEEPEIETDLEESDAKDPKLSN